MGVERFQQFVEAVGFVLDVLQEFLYVFDILLQLAQLVCVLWLNRLVLLDEDLLFRFIRLYLLKLL